MRMVLKNNGVYSTRELRTVLTQAKRLFLECVDRAPLEFEVIVTTRPRIRKLKGLVLNPTALKLTMSPTKPLPKGYLARAIAYFMLYAQHGDEWPPHRLRRPLESTSDPRWPPRFRPDLPLPHAPKKAKPKRDPQSRREAAIARLVRAQAVAVEQQKKLDQALRAVEQREAELQQLEKRRGAKVTLRSRESKAVLREQLRAERGEA
jgi:hypothetical protein